MENFSKWYRYRVHFFLGLIIVIVVFFGGYHLGQSAKSPADQVTTIINKNPEGAPQVDFAPFWQVWNDINEKYVPTNGTSTTIADDQTRVYGAIQGMVASLGDPYTVFFPPVENKGFNDQISGSLEGVGMEVDVKAGVLTVISPIKDSPAARAGMKTGDQILKINNTVTAGISTEDAVNLIRGPKGTTVKLTVVRAGIKSPFVVSIVRDVISVPTVETKTIGDVFDIQLYTFTATSPNLFREALRQFVESGDSKLVIDLRGNPGGYLDAAIDMASWFLPAGKTVVEEDFRNAQDVQVYRSKGYNIFAGSNLKLAILIDGGSASASEILAGALHDNGVATLVGTQSFGKGSVQELVPITPTTSLKVTIAKWLTPKGISISHQGIMPDVIIPIDEKAFAANGTDVQLNKAVQILDGK